MHRKNRASTTLMLALVGAASLAVLTAHAFAAGTPTHGTPAASSSRTVVLNETGKLHLTSKHGFTLNERGAATGTVKGTIYVHLTIASTRRVTAQVNIYPSGGSISGSASAGYHRNGSTGSFSGSISITRGTGSYNHAHGSGLSFSGTIAKSNDAITVHVSGRVSV